jgi:hypothetical protein
MGLNMALESLKNISSRDLSELDKRRFESKYVVGSSNQCWEWTAFKNKKGYGAIMYRDLGNIAAHRFSYLLYKGDFDKNKFICHTCDNPSCVNPSHLFVGTPSENMKDKILKGRAKNPPIHKGSKQHLAKMNPDKIREIRKLFNEGISQTELAKRYCLHTSTMNNICRNISWKDVK